MRKAIETLKNIWKIEDLRQRILITILFVALYRFGSYVVLPGINPAMLAKLHEQTSEGLLALLNMFSGGAFSNEMCIRDRSTWCFEIFFKRSCCKSGKIASLCNC